MTAKQMDFLDQSLSPSRVILWLSWPTIVEQILQTMVQYVDTAMVGSLGAAATAAVAVNTSTVWLINGLMNAVGLGFSVLAARYIGAGDTDWAKKVIRQAVSFIFLLGAILTVVMFFVSGHLASWLGADPEIIPDAVRYMRYVSLAYLFSLSVVVCSNILQGTGDTRTPMLFNISTNVINIILNFLFIFPTRTIHLFGGSFRIWGAGMGVAGAALATAIALAFSGTALLVALFRKKSAVRLSVRGDYRLNRGILREAARLGTPTALEKATLSFGQIALTALVAGVGTQALAAHQLAVTAESITYLPVNGFSVAATTLVAQTLGAGKRDMAKEYGRLCTIFGVIAMTATGALMFIFSHQLIGFFTRDLEVIALGGCVLRIEALAEPFFALAIVIGGVLRGAGDTKWPFYISLIGMWVVRLSIAFVLVRVFHLGLVGAWIGMVLDLVVRGILSLLRFLQGKWFYAWK